MLYHFFRCCFVFYFVAVAVALLLLFAFNPFSWRLTGEQNKSGMRLKVRACGIISSLLAIEIIWLAPLVCSNVLPVFYSFSLSLFCTIPAFMCDAIFTFRSS